MKIRQTQILLYTILLFVVYSLVWLVYTGDAGFSGDEWRMIELSYWYDFPEVLPLYIESSGRPLQTLHHLLMFETIGYNDFVANTLNFIIHGLSVIFCGIALRNVDPTRRTFYVSAMLVVFFTPVLTSTLYRTQFSGSYVAMMFFWASVVIGQVAVIKRWPSLWILVPLVYAASLYSYESAIALTPIAGLLVLLVYLRVREFTVKSFLWLAIRGSLAVGAVYALYFVPRMFADYGTHVTNRETIYLYNIYLYTITLPQYLAIPPDILSISAWGIGFTIVTAGAMYWILYRSQDKSFEMPELNEWLFTSGILATGGLIILLSSLPFLVAGYRPTVNLGGGGRVYSAAIYGLAILIALAYSIISKQRRIVHITASIFLTGWLGLWAGYHFSLGHISQEIEDQRQGIYNNWLETVPDVAPGTNLILVDFQTYWGDYAILEGTFGIRSLAQLLYDDTSVNGYFAYSGLDPAQATENRTMLITEDGILPRGRDRDEPIPFDEVIILQLEGSEVRYLPELAVGDTWLTAIWEDGVTEIQSNADLIEDQDNRERLESIGILR